MKEDDIPDFWHILSGMDPTLTNMLKGIGDRAYQFQILHWIECHANIQITFYDLCFDSESMDVELHCPKCRALITLTMNGSIS